MLVLAVVLVIAAGLAGTGFAVLTGASALPWAIMLAVAGVPALAWSAAMLRREQAMLRRERE